MQQTRQEPVAPPTMDDGLLAKLDAAIDERDAERGIRQVAREEVTRVSLLLHGLLGFARVLLLGGEVVDHDVRAFTREQYGHGATDPVRRTSVRGRPSRPCVR